MPKTDTPARYHLTLKDPGSEQRRFVSISRVPCPTCRNQPQQRGGYVIEQEPDAYGNRPEPFQVPACKTCDGRGDVPATEDSAAAHFEELEKEYAKFRLDDPHTIARYPTIPANALEVVEQTVWRVPADQVLIDGRFVRAGKVLRASNPDPQAPAYSRFHKGWLAFHEQEEPYKVLRVGSAAHEMVVTGGQFGVPLKNLYGGSNVWDWDTSTIKTALTTSSYVPDIDTHDFFNDVTNEITGTNYTAGGWTLTASAPSYDTASDQVRLDANDVSQASATFTARKSVTYQSTGTSSTSPLITFLDFGADVSPSAGTFTITWDATGIFVHDIT